MLTHEWCVIQNLYNKNSPKSQIKAQQCMAILSSRKVPQFDSLAPYFFSSFLYFKIKYNLNN